MSSSVSRTHRQFSKQPSLRGDQAWKQDGAAGGGLQQRLGGLGGSGRGPRPPGSGVAQLEGSSGSLYISVGRWPPTLCAITGLGASSKPQNPTSTGSLLLAVSLIGGRLSAPDLEEKLAGQSPLRHQPARPLRSRYTQALRLKGAQAPREGPAEACLCPGQPWALGADASEGTPGPAPSQALC